MVETKTDKPEVNVDTKTKQASSPNSEPKGGYWWGTGRRKSSVARVRIKPGDGKMVVNKKELKDYFVREQDRKAVLAPLASVDAEKSWRLWLQSMRKNLLISSSMSKAAELPDRQVLPC
jgi:hypothetical protein